MKIAIYSDNVAPYRIAWAEEIGKKHEVVFAYTKDKDAERNDAWLVKESKYCQLVKLPAWIIKNHAISLSVIKHIRKYKPDVIIFDGYGIVPNALAMLFLKLIHRKHYVNIDGIPLGVKESFIKKFIKKILFSKKNSYFLCGSNVSRKWLTTMGINENQIVVHNFSSIHEADIISSPITNDRKREYKNSLQIQEKPMVLTVGRFLECKQFDLLIKSFIKLDSKYQLYLIGEGPEKENYEKIIKENNLQNIVILDFMSYARLKEYYKAADLFVLPSYKEIWGLVINEAMSFGLPIVSSDRCVAGVALVDAEKNGYVFPFDDSEQLSKYIDTILSNSSLRWKMSEHSLEKIREYTIENTAKIHLRYLEQQQNNY